MNIDEQAFKMGVAPEDLYDYYRGLIPVIPTRKVEVVTEVLEPSFDGITHLGGGWYQVGNKKVQGLSRALGLSEGEEE